MYPDTKHMESSLTVELLNQNMNPVFIETGTNWGAGVYVAIMAGFDEIITIEKNRQLSKEATIRFMDYENVLCLCGDSSEELATALKGIETPITFWLDAHEFHQIPLLKELEIIKARNNPDDIIMIDDVRMFNSENWDKIGLDAVLALLPEGNETTFSNSINGENDILISKKWKPLER